MSKGKIERAKLDAVITKVGWEGPGLMRFDQASFTQLKCPAGRIYISLKETITKAPDWAEFTVTPAADYCAVDVTPRGRVMQELDLSRPEADIVAGFEKLLLAAKTLPKSEKQKPVAPGKARPRATGKPAGGSSVPMGPASGIGQATNKTGAGLPNSGLTDEQRRERRALIAKVAKEKGMGVSPKVKADFPLPEDEDGVPVTPEQIASETGVEVAEAGA